jgi:hypothetical protein
VNFDKQRLVIVGGGRVAVTKVEPDEKRKTVTVYWKLRAPGPTDAVPKTVTHPALLVLLDRADGEVKFEPWRNPSRSPVNRKSKRPGGGAVASAHQLPVSSGRGASESW